MIPPDGRPCSWGLSSKHSLGLNDVACDGKNKSAFSRCFRLKSKFFLASWAATLHCSAYLECLITNELLINSASVPLIETAIQRKHTWSYAAPNGLQSCLRTTHAADLTTVGIIRPGFIVLVAFHLPVMPRVSSSKSRSLFTSVSPDTANVCK